jgi:hypothetical protein
MRVKLVPDKGRVIGSASAAGAGRTPDRPKAALEAVVGSDQ